MKKAFFLAVFVGLQFGVFAQFSFFFGGNGVHYNYLESPQSNYAAKFNLGWDFAPSDDHQLIFFNPGTSNYTVKNELQWDHYARGLVGGFRFQTDHLRHEFYFQGCTNTGKGIRINQATTATETMHLYSKFGGINYALNYRVRPKFSLFYAFAFHRYKILYTWESTGLSVDKTCTGYDLKLSGALKPGSKNGCFSQAIGMNIEVAHWHQFSIEFRPEIRFAFNRMVEVYRGSYYESQIFNLNQVNASLLFNLYPNE